MTVGQRIAQKRKELGLSQEALGEQLGVSRQAIYKWESDATLPEIEKLVALSRIFSVPVGWLLGVEGNTGEQGGSGSELTESQLQMVEEIVRRYQDSQPKPPKKRRWTKAAGLIACVILVVVLVCLFHRLDGLSSQYDSLKNSLSDLAGQVEEKLSSQYELTADYSTEFVSIDKTGTTATFTWQAVPKTYQPGMVAYVKIVFGNDFFLYGPYDPVQGVFSGECTLVPLTDHIEIYIIFEHGGIRQTQLLDTYEDLYTLSFPICYVETCPMPITPIIDDNDQLLDDLYANLVQYDAQVRDYRVGLFADQTLVAWFTPCARTVTGYGGTEIELESHFLSTDGIVLDREKTYCAAAVVTDEYGREFVATSQLIHWTDGSWSVVDISDIGPFFEGWIY